MSSESLKLVCVGCGASLEYSASDRALKCPYCGSVTDIPGIEEEPPETVQAIVPLTVDVTALTDAVYQHLASGDMTPDHLLEHASITKKDRFYVPAFLYLGHFEATWTASFGYDRTEHYTEYETRFENGRNARVPVNKTRIVTDWRPVNGTDTGKFAVLAYAGEKLIGSTLKLTQLVEGGVPELAPYDASFVSGFLVEEFQYAESDVYRGRGKTLVDNVIGQSVRRHAQGDRQKDWHWTVELQRESRPALVPVCHAIYEFEGKQYNVWLSGFDASRIVADDLPVDNGRQRAVSASFVPFGGAVFGAGVAIFAMNSLWSVPMVAIATARMYGVLRRKAIVSYSHKIRQSLLARRKSSDGSTAGTNSTTVGHKPWLAHTANDKLLLPLIALGFAFIPICSALIWHNPSTNQEMAETPAVQSDSATNIASQQSANISENTNSQPASQSFSPANPSKSVAQNDASAGNTVPGSPSAASSVPLAQSQSALSNAQPIANAGTVSVATAVQPSPPHSNVSPSFNCQQAQSPTELEICADDNLSRLDAQMGRSYHAALNRASPDMAASIKSEQRQWLRSRDQQCASDATCIATQLTMRTQQLQQEMSFAATEARQPPPQLEQGKLEAAKECFKAANYDCSIQIAQALLEANPDDATATDLLQRSRAAQAQALQGNWNIH